jgi:hypothetical protein
LLCQPNNPRSSERRTGRHRAVFFRLEKAMPITEQQLLQILPNAGRNAGVFPRSTRP